RCLTISTERSQQVSCESERKQIVSRQSDPEKRCEDAPNDHLPAGPNCRVEFSRNGRISDVGRCPGVIGARINLGKSVSSGAWRCDTKFVAGSLGSSQCKALAFVVVGLALCIPKRN